MVMARDPDSPRARMYDVGTCLSRVRLNADFNQVMVVRDARDYIWFMSRTPQVSDEDYPAMPDRTKTMGYEAAGIKKVPERRPESGAGSQTFREACR